MRPGVGARRRLQLPSTGGRREPAARFRRSWKRCRNPLPSRRRLLTRLVLGRTQEWRGSRSPRGVTPRPQGRPRLSAERRSPIIIARDHPRVVPVQEQVSALRSGLGRQWANDRGTSETKTQVGGLEAGRIDFTGEQAGFEAQHVVSLAADGNRSDMMIRVALPAAFPTERGRALGDLRRDERHLSLRAFSARRCRTAPRAPASRACRRRWGSA